ncbi:MAG TPA: SusD/RagB family nutrient-binding outer membrane lipoprotein, partial [Bacteroidales bacterium]
MITNKWLFNKLSLISALLVLLGSGCTKNFEEWNTNPNQATAEMLQYDDLITGSLFVQMQKNVFPISQQPLFGDEVYQTMQNLCGDIYSGYMGSSGLWYSNVNNTTYAPIPNWYNQAFDRGFIGILPAWKSIKDVTIEQSAPQKLAIATIVKVEGLHRIADIYGPLPYINFGNGALQNTYDNLKDIYYKFFDELDTAINVLTIFNVQNPNSTPLSRYDFIFNGNVQMWIKFANTLKLRLAMRIVYADPSKAQAEAESAVNSPVGVFTNTSDVALLQHTSNMVYNHPLNIIC